MSDIKSPPQPVVIVDKDWNYSGGSSGSSSASEAKQDQQITQLNSVIALLQNQNEFSETVWTDDTGTFFVRVKTYDEKTGNYVLSYQLADGTSYVPTGTLKLAIANKDIETVTDYYVAKTGGTGYTTGDLIARNIFFDTSVTPATVQSTVWYNLSTSAVITAPVIANLERENKSVSTLLTTVSTNQTNGTQKTQLVDSTNANFGTVANPLNVSLPAGGATSANQTTANSSLSSIDSKLTNIATSGNQAAANSSLSSIDTKLTGVATAANQSTANTSLATIATNTTLTKNTGVVDANTLRATLATDGPVVTAIGNIGDSVASSDTGSFSLLAFVKRALQNWTTLLARIPSIPTTVQNGQVSATTSATTIGTGALTRGVLIKADTANTARVFIGATGVTSSNGFWLYPGEKEFVATNNLNSLFVVSASGTQAISYIGS